EAEARHRHQLGQPGIERIYHEQAGNERRPDHYRAETTTFPEQITHWRILLGGGCIQADKDRLLAAGQLRFDLLHNGPQFLLTALLDRKSTRLNSSHVKISYAVFCLKKKHAISASTSSGRSTTRPSTT